MASFGMSKWGHWFWRTKVGPLPLVVFLGFVSVSMVCGQKTDTNNVNNRLRNTNYHRTTRNRDQNQWPHSLRTISSRNGGSDNEEEVRRETTHRPHQLKLQNSLILNSDGLTYNVVRKQRTDLLRNSKEKSSSITFSSNLDSDEVTKTLPNKGRKITIVTPSTAVVARKLVLFPSTTRIRIQNTDTEFADNYKNTKLSESSVVEGRNREKYNSLIPSVSSLVSSSVPSFSSQNEFSGESASINHEKDERKEGKESRSFLIGRGRAKPLNFPLPTNNIPSTQKNNFAHLRTTQHTNANVSHSISVVSVKYSLSGPGIENGKEQPNINKSVRRKIPSADNLRDKAIPKNLKPEVSNSPVYNIQRTNVNSGNEYANPENVKRNPVNGRSASKQTNSSGRYSSTGQESKTFRDRENNESEQQNIFGATTIPSIRKHHAIVENISSVNKNSRSFQTYTETNGGTSLSQLKENNKKGGFLISTSSPESTLSKDNTKANVKNNQPSFIGKTREKIINATKLTTENNNKSNSSLTDIDERDGKSIRNQKHIVIKVHELSKDTQVDENKKKTLDEGNKRLEAIDPSLMSTPPLPTIKSSTQNKENTKIGFEGHHHNPTSSHKLIIHLSNNQNYSIKVGSPKSIDIIQDDEQHQGSRIAIKTRIKNLSSSSHHPVIPQESKKSSSNSGSDSSSSHKSQTNVKSDMMKSFLPHGLTSKGRKTSRDDERSKLSFTVEDENKENKELNNVQKKSSYNISEDSKKDQISKTMSHNIRSEEYNSDKNNIIITPPKIELDPKNNKNDRVHSSEKSPKEITEDDDDDYDHQINLNKGKFTPLNAESLQEDKADKKGLPSHHINDKQIKLNTKTFISVDRIDHVEKETLNGFESAMESKLSDKENVSNNSTQVKNKILDSSVVMHQNTSFNNSTQLDLPNETKISANKVQYSLNIGEEVEEGDNDKNKGVNNGDSIKDTDIFQTSPSVRDYYGQGRHNGKNIEDSIVPYNKDMSKENLSSGEISSTTLKYRNKKFELDYEEYSDETSFFGSDSSNDEVIPSQYEDAATYHEILVGAAQDPRYEHDEFVEESEYTGKNREYFPLNSDQETLHSEEYPERKKRPHIEINAVVGISVGAFFFILLGTLGLGVFIYHEKFLNKPQTLDDRYASSESEGGISNENSSRRISHIECSVFDAAPRDTYCEEMYNLDSDYFLNSLETFVIPNSECASNWTNSTSSSPSADYLQPKRQNHSSSRESSDSSL